MASKRKIDISDQLSGPLAEIYANQGGASSKGGRKTGSQLSNAELLKMQYELDAQAAQWQHDEEMYNTYQSPQAMMDQYESAGINPILAVTGGSVGSAPSSGSSSASAPSGDTSEASGADIVSLMMQIFQGFASTAGVAANIDNTVKQSRLTVAQKGQVEANSRLTNAEAEAQEIANADARDKITRTKEQHDVSIAEANKRIELMGAQINKLISDKNLTDKHVQYFDTDKVLEWNKALSEMEVNKSTAHLNAEQAKTVSLIRDVQKRLTEKQIDELDALIAKYEQECATLAAQADSYSASAESSRASANKMTEETATIVESRQAIVDHLEHEAEISAEEAERIGDVIASEIMRNSHVKVGPISGPTASFRFLLPSW